MNRTLHQRYEGEEEEEEITLTDTKGKRKRVVFVRRGNGCKAIAKP